MTYQKSAEQQATGNKNAGQKNTVSKLQSLALAVLLGSLASTASAQRSLPLSFLRVDGLYSSQSGLLYAAAGFDGTQLYRIRSDGRTQVFADGLQGPVDIAEDAAGNLYVTNFNTASVSKVSPNGEVSHFATVSPFPSGIVADHLGNFYVTHFGEFDPATGQGTGDTISKITPQGEVSVFAQGGYLHAPVGITVDENNHLYVGNLHDGVVTMIDPQGQQTFIADIADDVSYAIGHVEYVAGQLYATGIEDHALFRINPKNGRVHQRDVAERVYFPNGITYDAAENVLLIGDAFQSIATIERFRVLRRDGE